MTSARRFTLMLAAAAAFTVASSVQARAQIIYPFPPYGYPSTHADASVRLEVTPQDAEVYVDGYYAGIVDDFDGMLQRLRVEPGQHEIVLYRDGYRTVHERVYLARDRTFKFKQGMEKLPVGEVGEPRPIPAASAPPDDGAPLAAQDATGRLTIHVQPADATLVIDGQPWPASQGQDAVVLDLPQGRHVIQVRKPGYVGYLTEVEVRRGETTTVSVNLRPQP